MKTVLIAEDEKSIREFIIINLQIADYCVLEAANGKEALNIFKENSDKIDIAILDIMMPEMDGVELCRKIREINVNVGIIFLTAKTQEEDKVEGLKAGADDYVQKPFSTAELIARVDSLYRRVEYSKKLTSGITTDTIRLGIFELDLKKHILRKNNEVIELTHIEFQILECFFTSPNTSIERGYFLEKVWGDPYYGDDKVVDVNIRRLRLKIEDTPSVPKHLLTVWGQGYKWNE